MTGWNLPPGCNVSDLPGERPEDVAWCHYWESTDRPSMIWMDVYPDAPEPEDYFGEYDRDMKYSTAIDKDFEDWWMHSHAQ